MHTSTYISDMGLRARICEEHLYFYNKKMQISKLVKDLNNQFTENDILIVNKHINSFSHH